MFKSSTQMEHREYFFVCSIILHIYKELLDIVKTLSIVIHVTKIIWVAK